ncbi:hypothetical protein G8759_20095 [Spirosoma aureum]|uniref:Uncharacterized protein n=1 Tax=Spirosoma aureum TaxID=2692134 RepID=A0A6G9AQZ7_9BACT|nr:hypothetical protein [Spirosoma aureum]QIP14754.1 hypothetical protein G8759_20095 [Spirosoma aureum]
MATRNLKFLALDIDTKEIVELTRQQVIDYLDLTTPVPPVIDPPVIDPPVVVPRKLYGAPRSLIGNWTNDKGTTYGVYLGTGITTNLIVVLGSDPDAFMPAGFNLGYTVLSGKTKPTGPESPWGVKAPAGFVPPLEDYDVVKFPVDGATYYRLKAGSASVKTLETVFGDTYVLNK